MSINLPVLLTRSSVTESRDSLRILRSARFIATFASAGAQTRRRVFDEAERRLRGDPHRQTERTEALKNCFLLQTRASVPQSGPIHPQHRLIRLLQSAAVVRTHPCRVVRFHTRESRCRITRRRNRYRCRPVRAINTRGDSIREASIRISSVRPRDSLSNY